MHHPRPTRSRFAATALLAALVLGGGWLGGVAPLVEAVVPGENGKIAFASDRDGDGHEEIFVMSPRGESKRRKAKKLTNNADFGDFAPDWSPDGTQIAITGDPDGAGPANTDIYVAAATGGDRVKRTKKAAADESPSWQTKPGTRTDL